MEDQAVKVEHGKALSNGLNPGLLLILNFCMTLVYQDTTIPQVNGTSCYAR